MMDVVYALPVLAVGLVLGVVALPWKRTQWKNASTLEYWTMWVVFWWFILPMMLVQAAGTFLDRRRHHLARKAYDRSKT